VCLFVEDIRSSDVRRFEESHKPSLFGEGDLRHPTESFQYAGKAERLDDQSQTASSPTLMLWIIVILISSSVRLLFHHLYPILQQY
jgi:hypothetical protein